MEILIVGLGSIAKRHINAIWEINSKAQIYALRSSEKASVINGVTNLFKIEDLLNYTFDFCIISSPTAIHEQHIKILEKLKIPLFIEKPLSHQLSVSHLVDELKDRKTYIACNLRFLDSIVYVKELINNSSNLIIQEVTAYCGSYLPSWRKDIDYKENYSAIPELGGGVHLDLIHELDYLYWLLGSPKHVSKTLTSNSALDIKSIDFAHYQLFYPSFIGLITLNYFRRKSKRTLEIVFNEYTIMVDLLNNSVYKDEELIYCSEQTILDTYKKQMEYFIDTQSPFNNIEEAYEILKICLKKSTC